MTYVTCTKYITYMAYTGIFFFYIIIYTKSRKIKAHATVPRRHIFSSVAGELKC